MKAAHPTALVLLCVFVVGTSNSTEAAPGDRPAKQKTGIFAHANLEKAWQAAVVGRRPLLVMFSTDTCRFCDKMLADTYSHPVVRRMLVENTESVKINAKHYPELVQQLGIRGYPTSVLVSPEGKVLDVITGYTDAKAFTTRVAPLLRAANLSRTGQPEHAVAAVDAVEVTDR